MHYAWLTLHKVVGENATDSGALHGGGRVNVGGKGISGADGDEIAVRRPCRLELKSDATAAIGIVSCAGLGKVRHLSVAVSKSLKEETSATAKSQAC